MVKSVLWTASGARLQLVLGSGGDGSNTTSDNPESFSKWPAALIEAVSQFDNVILVAHSTGGMYALSVPELESRLEGLDIFRGLKIQQKLLKNLRHMQSNCGNKKARS